MLHYFIENKHIPQIAQICDSLNSLKSDIKNHNFETRNADACKPLFQTVTTIARQENDEQLANASFVFKKYYNLFYSLCCYFSLLDEGRYRISWDKLQDCLDLIKLVGKFTEQDERLDIPQLLDLLQSYEQLYPFRVFASSEYIIEKSHCSICGKSMNSLSCSHIRGNLYWGEMAVEIVDEIKTFQAVAVVSHPEDKRCVLELSDDDRPEEEKFKKLKEYLNITTSPLMRFTVETKIETRLKDNIKIVGRNEPCSCDSGFKFKKCCGKNLYYKHERNIVHPLEEIELVKI